MSDESESTNECQICANEFTKTKKPLTCCHCEMQACQTCVRRYMIESIQGPHCMGCKKAWSGKFVSDNITKSWLTGDYRKSRQKLFVDREKSRLPQTLSIYQERLDAQNEMKGLQAQATELRKQVRALEIKIAELRNVAEGNTTIDKAKAQYMFPCPAAECRGYIEHLKWKCGLCQTKICKSCHVVKKSNDQLKDAIKAAEDDQYIDAQTCKPVTKAIGKNKYTYNTEHKICVNKSGTMSIKDAIATVAKHVCKQSDVDTAKEVVKSTKPCPNCRVRIYKSIGCPQMWCTQCHTAFSWDTGAIEKGMIHNPHYFELQAKLGTVRRNERDVPCGGVDAQWILNSIRTQTTARVERGEFSTNGQRRYINDYEQVLQRVGEVNDRVTRLVDTDFLETRIAYLGGKLNEKTFRAAIFRIERKNEKMREERQILETFRVSTIERLNALVDDGEPINEEKLRKTYKDVVNIVDFCNSAFRENYTVLGYTSFPKIMLDRFYNGR